MARSKRTLLSALLSVGLIAGLLAVTQVPASAQTQPADLEQYMPDQTVWGTTGGDASQLSDKQDGQDTAAHLTVVATSDTTHVVWYVCPNTVDEASGAPADPDNNGQVTATELASCEEIGRDSEPRTPTRSGPGTQIDEAYDTTWDITAGQEGNRDILAIACIGTGERIEGSNFNCIQDLEENIFVDNTGGEDVSTGTSAGEFLSYSTSAGPIAGGENPDASTFTPFPHGSSVPDDGFVFRATTSPDVTGLSWDLDENTGGAVAPEGFNGDSTGACVQIASSLTAKTWRCNVTDAAFPASTGSNGEHALAITATGGAVGACNPTNCILDVHYIVSGARGTITALASFETAGNQNGATACTTAPDKEERNAVDAERDAPADRTATGGAGQVRAGTSGNEETVRGCLKDQFGNAQTTPTAVTYESSGVATAGFSSCGSGGADTMHDHDGDGYYEHCHTTTNGAGFAQAVIDNYGLSTTGSNGQPGTQTVRFCTDVQNGAGTNSTVTAPVGHGCADEAAGSQDTVSKEWVAVPTHIHLVYDGTGDPANPCHTGDQFKENVIGDRDTLRVCTRDGADRPSTTNQTNGGRMQWTIFPNTSGQQTATRFDCSTAQGACPPSETDANGEATVVIEAINEGTDQIQVQLFDDLGNLRGTDFVQKRVRRSQETPTSTPPPTVDRHDRSVNITKVKHVKLNRRSRALLIKGQVNSPDFESCATQVPIKVQLRKGGEWLTRKSDTTNDNGVFKVLIRDIQGKYRAVATKFIVEDPDNNVTNVCRRAADKRRHRH